MCSGPGLAEGYAHVEVLSNGRSKLPVRSRAAGTSASVTSNLLLCFHETLLDPLTIFAIAPYRVGVEELSKRGLDVLVDLEELVGIFGIGEAVAGPRA